MFPLYARTSSSLPSLGKAKRLVRNFLSIRKISYKEEEKYGSYLFQCTKNQQYCVASPIVSHYTGKKKNIVVPVELKFTIYIFRTEEKEDGWDMAIVSNNNDLCLGHALNQDYIDAVRVDHPSRRKVVTLRKKLDKFLIKKQ